jgi:hypothetical protein
MIAVPPEGTRHSRPKGARWFGLTRRNPRDQLRLTVAYRGGAEGWIEVHARGQVGFFPSHAALADVVWEVNQAR